MIPSVTSLGVPEGFRVTWDRIVPGLEQIPVSPLPLTDNTLNLGSASFRWATVYANAFVGTYAALGTNPAQTGPVRLANNAYVYGRNFANNGDVQVIGLNASDLPKLPTATETNDLIPQDDAGRQLGTATKRWQQAHLFGIYASVDSYAASTTQTQGQGTITTAIAYVSTVANANDVVTLPAAVAGRFCEVKNGGANTLQVFPDTGDAINGGAVNASIKLAAGEALVLRAINTTTWHTLGAALSSSSSSDPGWARKFALMGA